MGKKGGAKKKCAGTKDSATGEEDISLNGHSDSEPVSVAESDVAIEQGLEKESGDPLPTDVHTSEHGNITASTQEAGTEVSGDDENVTKNIEGTTSPAHEPAAHNAEQGEEIAPPSAQKTQTSEVLPPKVTQRKVGQTRRVIPGSSRYEFLKTLMENEDEEQLLDEFAKKMNILSRLSSTSMSAVTSGSDLAEEESRSFVRNDRTKPGFKDIYKIQLPFPLINESVVMPPHNYGPEWDKLLYRTYDSDYLECYHLNYPRRNSVDVYAENLLWIRNLLANITDLAKSLNQPGAAVDITKFTKSREHDFIDVLIKKEFRGSLLQRVRNDQFFLEDMYEDEISVSSKRVLYSPYFTTNYTQLKDDRIVAAQVTLAASILLLKLTDDALHNGRLLSCIAYGHMGLTLAGKFFSLAKDKDSFTTLELLYYQRLVTALYRLAIYADLGGKVVDVFDEVTAAFRFLDVFHLVSAGEECPKSYLPDNELMKFIANIRNMKAHFYDDRQLLWERHFMVVLRTVRTINYYVERLHEISELDNLKDRSNTALKNILDALAELDAWEDHLSFYTCHNLAARLLHYKAQIVNYLAEFVTDYRTCYQYVLTKITGAIELEQKLIPNIDVVFHRQCVSSFKVAQTDAALRMMWEVQSPSDVHENITLLQRVMDHRTPTWVLRKNDDCAISILASILLLDYLSGLTSYLSTTVVQCMKNTAFEHLKETKMTDSLRDAAASIVWDKLEKLFLVKRERTLEESLRLVKISFYLLPVLAYNHWTKNSEELMQIYNSVTQAHTASLTEVKESYTVTKDPNFCFGQKMLHDFTQNWAATRPSVSCQNSWPKPWKLDNTNEFECGMDKKVYFMNNKPVPTETLEAVFAEFTEKNNPEKTSMRQVTKKLNHKEFQSTLGSRVAQYVIRSNDFELNVMKEELRVIVRDKDRLKIQNFGEFVSFLIFMLSEIESALENKRNQSKLPVQRDQYTEWHKTVKNLVDYVEKQAKEKTSAVKVLQILFTIALVFGFPIKQYIENMPGNMSDVLENW